MNPAYLTELLTIKVTRQGSFEAIWSRIITIKDHHCMINGVGLNGCSNGDWISIGSDSSLFIWQYTTPSFFSTVDGREPKLSFLRVITCLGTAKVNIQATGSSTLFIDNLGIRDICGKPFTQWICV